MIAYDAMANELLSELKVELRVTEDMDDANLSAKLMRSMDRINRLLGVEVDFVNDLSAKELLFGRVRYDYNNALEYWETNFHGEILALQLQYGISEMKEVVP